MTEAETARLTQIQNGQKKGAGALEATNISRKERILLALFNNRIKLTALLQMYKGLLPKFQTFLKLVQRKEPMLHVLHIEMMYRVHEFLALFIRPADVPDIETGVKSLIAFDPKKEDYQLPNKLLSIRPHAYHTFQCAHKE